MHAFKGLALPQAECARALKGLALPQAECVHALKGLALPQAECARVQRTGATSRESLWREHLGGHMSPALHACDNASSLGARCCYSSQELFDGH